MIAVIFEVTPKANGKDEYFDIASTLKSTLVTMDGFISIERFVSMTDSNKVLSLSFWQDEQSVIAWREQTSHQRAQAKGRNCLFEDYRLRVAHVLRDYGMNERAQAPLVKPKRYK